MKISQLASLLPLILFAAPPAEALSPGDCMVVGYNSAGSDAISFVTWVELANGESITITDADYAGGGDGSGEGTGGGSYGGSIDTIVWTNDTGSPIAPGTVIVLPDTASPSANIGSASGGFGLTNQGEHFFLVQGSFNGSGNLIGQLLFGLDYDGSGSWGESGESALPGALNVANGNLSFAHVDAKEFNGSRSGLPLGDYPAQIMSTGNWASYSSTTLSAEAFVAGGDPPEPEPDQLGAVSEGLLFHPRRMNNNLPILDESWSLAQGAGSGDADNLNGPSCVRLPTWLPAGQRADPSAEYYLYFADHSGHYIRMAWAADLEGPWTGYRMDESPGEYPDLGDRGVLSLGDDNEIHPGDDIIVHGHIASPQVFIEGDSAANVRFVMYYHGKVSFGLPLGKAQRTAAATSSDGLNFNMPSSGDSRAGQAGHGTLPVSYGESYFRVFEQAGRHYSLTNTGDLYEAPDPDTNDPLIPDASYNHASAYWDKGPKPFTTETGNRGWIDWGDGFGALRPRHFGVLKRDGFLYAFLTNKSGSPERIKVSTFDFADLPSDYNSWKGDFPNQELIRPEENWEGTGLPLDISEYGSSNVPVHQLRDPGILEDSDGRTYMFYSGSGEKAIGVAQIVSRPVVSGSTEVTTGEDHTFTVSTDVDVTPYIVTGDDEDDRFLLCVEGLHSGSGFSESTGSGKPFVIRVRTSYEQFLADHFTEAERADPAISGESADPDGDGLTNVLEHVFGTDPHETDGGVVTIGDGPGVGVDPQLSFPWDPEANYTYQLQMSTDLNTFERFGLHILGGLPGLLETGHPRRIGEQRRCLDAP